ncbi:uncharacterized protein LOC135197545 [Macrobrachium nipponense]|uniref:uncharacterized protein LOC135197545 n=1 Tax=Macrobrachium nipponense TaxID=159736 RepID=UPI0030C7F2BA
MGMPGPCDMGCPEEGLCNSRSGNFCLFKSVNSSTLLQPMAQDFDSEYERLCRSYRAITRCVRKAIATTQKTMSEIDTGDINQRPALPPSAPTNPLPPPKLPAIKIPEFSGGEEEWLAFWDIFNSLVHDRRDISDVIKFSILRASLRDNAFKAIEGLLVTNANYSVAIQTLKEKYDNKEKLKRRLMSKLTHLVPPSHTIEDLNTFKLEYEIILQMSTLNLDVEAMNPIFSSIICEKLSPKTRKAIANKHNSMSLDLKQISSGLKYVCELMEFCYEGENSNKRRRDQGNYSKVIPSNVQNVQRAQPSNSKPSNSSPYNNCVFCSSNMPLTIQTLLHHLSLHNNPLASSLMKNFYVDNFSKKLTRMCPFLMDEYPVINAILEDANMPLQEWTALPTANVIVSGNGHRSFERAFFDSGAQRTFIATELPIRSRSTQDTGGPEDSNTQIESRLRERSPLHDEQSLDFLDLKFLSSEDKTDHDITVKAGPVVHLALPEAFSQDLFAEGISEDAGEEAANIDDDSSSNLEDGSEVGGVTDIDDGKDSEKEK